MTTFLKILPVILGSLPSLIQLAENAFGGKAPSQQAHQDAVTAMIMALVNDAAGLIPNSNEATFIEKIVKDLAGSAVAAWYDVKNFLEGQNQPTKAATTTASK